MFIQGIKLLIRISCFHYSVVFFNVFLLMLDFLYQLLHCAYINSCCACTFWQYLCDSVYCLPSLTCTCCFCVLSMLGSMLSGPSTLIISSFSLSHGPS